jgi:Arc/MetJ family transcription regulator
MGINISVDEHLIEEAKKVTGQSDATAAVEQLLRAATQPKKSPLQGMLELAGRDLIRDDYDYKAMRVGSRDDVSR